MARIYSFTAIERALLIGAGLVVAANLLAVAVVILGAA